MTVAVLLLIATLLPLLSFVILAFVGKRMGNPLAGIVGTFFIAAAFVCSLAAMIVWLSLDVAEGRAYGFGGQPIPALLHLLESLFLLHARAGARGHAPSALHLLGTGRPLLLSADRLLV